MTCSAPNSLERHPPGGLGPSRVIHLSEKHPRFCLESMFELRKHEELLVLSMFSTLLTMSMCYFVRGKLEPSPETMSNPICVYSQFTRVVFWFQMECSDIQLTKLSKFSCDVVLLVGAQRIPAHRLVLASCSGYFRAMFTSGMAEAKQR